MNISDKPSLSVRMTALYIAKWEADAKDTHVITISGSPFFAKLYNELVDDMIRLDGDNPGKVRK